MSVSRAATLSLLVVLGWVPAAAAHVEGSPCGERTVEAPCDGNGDGDRDRDGIRDRVEARTGTSPLKADTDADGVPDGVEDRDGDGRVDPGESDPRSAGLFPGSAPHIPEPLVFDLVRGLGARRGELEVNTLVVMDFPRGSSPVVAWAPELEWAPFDGFAVELELPHLDRELHAIKGALQYTLPFPGDAFTHGLQWLGEGYLAETGGATALLYLAGGRLGDWTLFSMLGARVVSHSEPDTYAQALLNPSVFYDVAEKLTVGVETNVALAEGHAELRVVPQLHYQLSRRLRVQLGGGFMAYGEQLDPLAATRVVVE
ncbi:MAG TPA: hypothetical protein VLC09_18950 [Polyangiaceae bacterium]|nr:hypothetical protein [Polyangiaceae bacterium]